MIKSKEIGIISILLIFLSLIVVYCLFSFNLEDNTKTFLYENKLFDDNYVHKINIYIDTNDLSSLLKTPSYKEFFLCDVQIDNDFFNRVGIRVKGDSSLKLVEDMGDSKRYSLRIDFNFYDGVSNYFGLNKLDLNNSIMDPTYLKDYFLYDMMRYMNVPAPLVSFSELYINGEFWGLYYNVEYVGKSFLLRNFGTDFGSLYKPEVKSPTVQIDGVKELLKYVESLEISSDKKVMISQYIQENIVDGIQSHALLDLLKNNGISEKIATEIVNSIFEEIREISKLQEIDVLGCDFKYNGEDLSKYSNIFNNAKTKISEDDKLRLLNSIRILNNSEDISSVLNLDILIPYFVVHNFVCSEDGYTCKTLHNYYLYEKDGKMTLLPWDYNISFDIDDIDMDIYSPMYGYIPIEERPLLNKVILNYKDEYSQNFSKLLSEYFESGYFDRKYNRLKTMIYPYLDRDTTSFFIMEEDKKGFEAFEYFIENRGNSLRQQLK